MQGHGRCEQPGLLWCPVLGSPGVPGLNIGVVMLPEASELLPWTDSSASWTVLASQAALKVLVAIDQQDVALRSGQCCRVCFWA